MRILLCCLAATGAHALAAAVVAAEPARPNIVWITSEDNGPHLGCYGDSLADTPNLDRLAAKSLRYTRCWSNAPVCAPARTAIIAGVYPTSLGAEHMRSLVPMPRFMQMYPQLLRQAGYYCTNNSKEDYNLQKPGQVWDESSGKAHWKNRREGQPFFAVFNHTVSHESQIRQRPHRAIHDPFKVRIPAYHPDAPEVRQDWAQYYDQITAMDRLAGENLRELEQAGLAEDTIIFYYADHGSGMPRHKRCPYNSGLQVPLIVHIPEKFRHLWPEDYQPGGESRRLVAFVDFAPTLLSLIGVKPPDWMQGRAFLGEHIAPPREFNHGFRGRMDERYDMIRSVTDGRYVYVRNYMPHRPHGQYLWYMFQTPTTRVWKRLFDEGKLTAEQSQFWQPKPPEELYDLATDPDEVHNLVDSPEHQEVLERLRQAQREHLRTIRDVGFLPEGEIHSRSADTTPYEAARDEMACPLEVIAETAELAASLQPEAVDELRRRIKHPDSAVRYWAALGLLMRGKEGVAATGKELRGALIDTSPFVRITAAEALGRFGTAADARMALTQLLDAADVQRRGLYCAVYALNALDELDETARPALEAIKGLPTAAPNIDARMNSYVPRLLEKTLADLNTPAAK